MRLLLLRHGQTDSNLSGALDTAFPGADLTRLGRQQARAAARALSTEPITHLAISSLVRTSQTVAPLAASLSLTPLVHVGLGEITAGDFEMRNDHEAVSGFLGTVGAWLDGDLARRMPGGENGEEFLDRYDAAVDSVLQAAGSHATLLVVSHGAAIRTWVTHRARGDHAPLHEGLHNTGCIRLDGDPSSGWQITDWGREPVGGPWLEDEDAPDPTGGELDD